MVLRCSSVRESLLSLLCLSQRCNHKQSYSTPLEQWGGRILGVDVILDCVQESCMPKGWRGWRGLGQLRYGATTVSLSFRPGLVYGGLTWLGA